jgi:signal transduction histidine kinase
MKYARKKFRQLKRIFNKISLKLTTHIYKSLRLEILTLISIAFLIASLGGLSVTRLAKSLGIGEWQNIYYENNAMNVQYELSNLLNNLTAIEELSEIPDIDINALKFQVENEAIWDMGNQILEDYADNLYVEFINEKIQSEEDWQPLFKRLQTLIQENTWHKPIVAEAIKEYLQQDLELNFSEVKDHSLIKAIERFEKSTAYFLEDSQTYIADSQGQVILKDTLIQQIDIMRAIEKSNNSYNHTESISIYPIVLDKEICYLFNESKIKGETKIYYSSAPVFLGLLGGAAIFVILMYYFTKGKLRYLEYISYCLGEVSKGDLDYEIEVKGKDELAQVAIDIMTMKQEIKQQIIAQQQAEKTKNELITNVAHDLRTPLTAIIGYIGLVKEGKFHNLEQMQRYATIAYNKTEKLQHLIEDLFEYTKLSNQEVELKKSFVSLGSLLHQLVQELSPLAEEKDIKIKLVIMPTETTLFADITKLTRVFENLIENAIKYTIPTSLVYILLEEEKGQFYVTVRNQCNNITAEDIKYMFDRFYRADVSRNSDTGGSGLGLAIAKNIILLHQGDIWAQLNDKIISLNVRLPKP